MVAARLTLLRKENELSQQDLAVYLHVSRSAYSAYETGRRSPPLDILLRLAAFYDTTTDYLLGLSDDPLRPLSLDPLCGAVAEDYLRAEGRVRSQLYEQHLLVRELIRFGTPPDSPE